MQVVRAANVALADEHLRHGTAAAAPDHLRALFGLRLDVDLLDATPLPVSNARALWQYGHQSLQYMTTGGALMRPSAAGQGQILGTPGRQAAAQIEYLGETLLHQRTHGCCGRGAAVAIDDQRALFVFLE